MLSSISQSGAFTTTTTSPSLLTKRFATNNNESEMKHNNDETTLSRRNFVTSSLIAATAMTTMGGNANAAATTEMKMFQDTECNFQLSIPSSWAFSEQMLGDRRKIVFFVDTDSAKVGDEDKTLLFIAYTPLRDDFTTISSFGSVDQVAQSTILPKNQLALAEENESKMISAESKKNAYYFDYTIKVPEQPKRHFRTIFDLKQGATGGAGAVLVTLTAQTTSKRYDDEGVKSLFDEIIDSYGKIPK